MMRRHLVFMCVNVKSVMSFHLFCIFFFLFWFALCITSIHASSARLCSIERVDVRKAFIDEIAMSKWPIEHTVFYAVLSVASKSFQYSISLIWTKWKWIGCRRWLRWRRRLQRRRRRHSSFVVIINRGNDYATPLNINLMFPLNVHVKSACKAIKSNHKASKHFVNAFNRM